MRVVNGLAKKVVKHATTKKSIRSVGESSYVDLQLFPKRFFYVRALQLNFKSENPLTLHVIVYT